MVTKKMYKWTQGKKYLCKGTKERKDTMAASSKNYAYIFKVDKKNEDKDVFPLVSQKLLEVAKKVKKEIKTRE